MSEIADKLARSLTPGLNAHKLVAATAIEMAQALFEEFMQDNALYGVMKAKYRTEKSCRRRFVKQVAPKFLEEARRALSNMLIQEHVSQMAKDEIYEALILDNEMRANRVVAKDKATLPAVLMH